MESAGNLSAHHPGQQFSSPSQQDLLHQPYHDTPSRDIMSPPPHYTSNEQVESPSTSPTRPLYSENIERHSIGSRESHREPYVDDSPPPPPPHRTSLSRSTRRESVPQKPPGVMAASIGSSNSHTSSDGSDRVPQDTYLQEGGPDLGASQQPSLSQANYRPDHLHSINRYAQRPPAHLPDRTSYSSSRPFVTDAATPGSITPVSTPDVRSSRYSGRSIPLEDFTGSVHHPMANYYNDSPYHNSGHTFDAAASEASINPYNIADDGDDGFMPHPKRKSALPMPFLRGKGPAISTTAAGTAAVTGQPGGLFGGKAKTDTANDLYGPTDGTNSDEKSGWLTRQKNGNKKMRLLVGLGFGFATVLVIIAGVVGGVLGTHQSNGGSKSGGSINNAGDDAAANGDLDLNSAEIKKLLNNANLHKVFPGMDYTPWGVQYPLCLTYPPSQNNVTRDMAVLSQLTNTVRLYGTDCNQTEMVLHAIDKLQLTSMKVWLGVWVDTNSTTTDRQITQMYKLLSEVKDKSIFKGAIIGNEALYRAGEDKAQSKQELITLLTDTKSNFTSLGYDLPVATSDLGDNWTADLVAVSDYVMSNIHPFFAGVTADVAAAWTWNFWQTHDNTLTTGTNVKQIISETGWPSGGGTDCGGSDGSCATGQSGAVASIDNMNTFMNDWVCQALANGTDYFWFEAFDEPWKVQYNTATQAWEDKWGLMDQARNLKTGIKIPNCGGTTVS